jgi:long-subunit fatty acid transport protein
MAKGRTFLNFGVSYGSSPVPDKNRKIVLAMDDSWTLSVGVAHTLSEALTLSLGGGIVLNGSAPVEQVTQGFEFSGKFHTYHVLVPTVPSRSRLANSLFSQFFSLW